MTNLPSKIAGTKATSIIKMENTASRYFCPRLVDYIAIVGARKCNGGDTSNASTTSMSGHISSSSNVNSGTGHTAAIGTTPSGSTSSSYSVQMPELLRRYPPEDHKDFPLPPDVVFFCQPEGCFFVKAKRSAVRETNTFVFTLMEKDTNRIRYGVVLNFYRPVERKKVTGSSGCQSTATTTCTFSNKPSPLPSSETDRHHHQQQFDSQIASVSDNGVNRPSTTTSTFYTESPVTKSKKQCNMSCLTSLCLLSHHPFFSTFRECLFVLKRLIDVCSERNCSRKSPTSHHGKK